MSGVPLDSTPSVSGSTTASMGEKQAIHGNLLDFGSDTITILVGPDNAKFTVHAEQLKKSPFFENAMKELWLVDRTISLPIDDPATLRYYFHFLYASQVPADDFESLAILYVYGEKVVDLDFKHAVIEAIINSTHLVQEDGMCHYPITKAVDCIYEGTLEGSPARQLLVDIFAVHGIPSWIGDWEYDPQFLRELVLRRMREHEGEEKIMHGHEIVADRYLETHGKPKPYHKHLPSDHQGGQRENSSNTGSSSTGSNVELHPRLSPDSRTALAAYDERLRHQGPRVP